MNYYLTHTSNVLLLRKLNFDTLKYYRKISNKNLIKLFKLEINLNIFYLIKAHKRKLID